MSKRRSPKRGLGIIVDGTTYKDDADPRVVSILSTAHRTRERLCIRYGDRKTGRDWGDLKMCCRIGRSTGTEKIPLCIKTSRSRGGEGLLESHIVRIEKSGRVVYSHPKYHKE